METTQEQTVQAELLWTPPVAAKIGGVHRATLENWIRDGLVPLAQCDRSRGKADRRLDIRGLHALVTIRELKKHNASFPQLQVAAEFLRNCDSAEMLANFKEGRRLLVMSGEILKPHLARLTDAIANQAGFTVMLAAVDLCDCWQILLYRLNWAEAHREK